MKIRRKPTTSFSSHDPKYISALYNKIGVLINNKNHILSVKNKRHSRRLSIDNNLIIRILIT